MRRRRSENGSERIGRFRSVFFIFGETDGRAAFVAPPKNGAAVWRALSAGLESILKRRANPSFFLCCLLQKEAMNGYNI